MLRSHSSLAVLAFLCVHCSTPEPAPHDDQRVLSDVEKVALVFGVVPQQNTSKMAESWTPILTYLSQRTGYQLIFKTAPSMKEFEQRLEEGRYDIAYMNPQQYVDVSASDTYRVFSRQKDHRIRGIAVVRTDDPAASLDSLGGSEMAFSAPRAFAASIVVRSELSRRDIPFVGHYVKSHDSVYRGVAKGLYRAGGGIPRTLQALAPDVRDQLRVLWTSPGYAPHAIAAHRRVDADVVARLGRAMVTMADDPEGARRLAPLRFRGIERADDADWDSIRELQNFGSAAAGEARATSSTSATFTLSESRGG